MKKNNANKMKQADLADRHILYEKSVQDPDTEIPLMLEKFQQLRGREPVSFREDFSGTAHLSTAWCKGSPDRTAVAVDLCKETLEWGRVHNVEAAGEEVAKRVSLVNANVLEVTEPKVDIACAFNFSYNIFKDRDSLRDYFKAVHAGLKDDGVLVMDIYGGTESMNEVKEKRKVNGEFTFVWEQKKFNPITHDLVCNIHFHFPDGSKMKNAFHYEWRLWTLPELRELLLEAGFSKVHVFWEEFEDNDDDDDEYLEPTGRYVEVEEVENQESWISYLFVEA